MLAGILKLGPIALPSSSQIAARKALRGLFRTASVWRAHTKQRHTLLMLDDHILRDIGLTREDIDREARKPFWRA